MLQSIENAMSPGNRKFGNFRLVTSTPLDAITPMSNCRRRPAARPLTSSHPDPGSKANIRQGNCWEHQFTSPEPRSPGPPWRDVINVPKIGHAKRVQRVEHGRLDDLDGDGLGHAGAAPVAEPARRRLERAQEAAGRECALGPAALESGPAGRDPDDAVDRGGDAEGEGRQRAHKVKVPGVEALHVLAPGDPVRPDAELEPGHVRRAELWQGEDAELLVPELAVRLETLVRGSQKQTCGGREVIELGGKNSSTRQTLIQRRKVSWWAVGWTRNRLLTLTSWADEQNGKSRRGQEESSTWL